MIGASGKSISWDHFISREMFEFNVVFGKFDCLSGLSMIQFLGFAEVC
jgi:hypothetical protein